MRIAPLALRRIARRPLFAFFVVVPLALAIGAVGAIANLFDAVLLHPIHLPDEDAVVSVHVLSRRQDPLGPMSYADYDDLRARASTLTGLAAYSVLVDAIATSDVHTELARVSIVSPNYFDVLRVPISHGRGFSRIEAADAASTVVIAPRLATRIFSGAASAVGRQLVVGGKAFTVIGVSDPAFRGVDLSASPDLWLPITSLHGAYLGAFDKYLTVHERIMPLFQLVGRRRSRATLNQVDVDLSAIMSRLFEAHGSPFERYAVSATPLNQAAAGRGRAKIVGFIGVLGLVASLLLLLACVAVVNLFLVRGEERRGDLATRAALGASRTRLIGELLGEGIVLAAIAGIAGAVAAKAIALSVARFMLPGGIALEPVSGDVSGRALVCAVALSVLCVITFCTWPAVVSTRTISSAMSRHSGRVTAQVRADVLVGVQLFISALLLAAALTCLRSLRTALATNLGFRYENLAAATIVPIMRGGSRGEALALARRVLDRAHESPGIKSVALTTQVPLEPLLRLSIDPIGYSSRGTPYSGTVGFVTVSPGFFSVLGVSVIEGRDITEADATGASVVVINQAAARPWAGESAIGKQLVLYGKKVYTIIGVVRNTSYATMDDADTPVVFAPLDTLLGSNRLTLVARSDRPISATHSLQAAIAAIAPDLPATDVRTVPEQVARTLMPQQAASTLLSVFAVLACAICLSGLYGTLSYIVGRRAGEIAIRGALGAPPEAITRLVLGQTGIAVVAGTLLGAAVSVVTTQLLRKSLFGIGAADLASLGTTSALLILISIGISVEPVWRALRIDPIQVLRRLDR